MFHLSIRRESNYLSSTNARISNGNFFVGDVTLVKSFLQRGLYARGPSHLPIEILFYNGGRIEGRRREWKA